MQTLLRMAVDYRDAITGAHRNVRLFFLAAFLSQMSGGFTSILYNLYIKSLGLPDTVAGAYVSAWSLAGVISLVPAGIISDRLGRKRAIVGAGLISAVVSIGQVFVTQPFWIVASAFINGLVQSVIWVSILPFLAENTAQEERFHLFSVNFAIGLVAQVLGSFVAGSLAQGLGAYLGPVWSIRAALLVGGVFAISAVIPFSRTEEMRRPDQLEAGPPARRAGWREMWPRLAAEREQFALIVKFTVCSALIGFGAGLVIPYLNLYFAERFHMAKAGIGLVIGLAQACTALAMFVGPALAKRFGPVRAAVGLQMASIPFLLITGWASNVWLASGAVIVRNALMNSASPIQDSVMMALVHEDVRGLAVSLGQTLWTLGWAVMGPVSTQIVHLYGPYTGYAIAFSGTALLYLLGSSLYRIWFGRYESKVYTPEAEADAAAL
ncbi:MAG: MFS transporter [Alicyclobacillus macrosporangiidus]|uniref:MFS transporter n=1 Tax=Alicyclobacillus macrosporangiidus TaxID=392015 RepID=UPI0026EBF329|nr:MFS transporter [Alicyclobacillus macrosporangiidus]MCL6599201.1 MFS transporter [Alicyclobacillus macrosporangiidus]